MAVSLGSVRFCSAVLQVQTGDPLALAAALLTEAVDVLQSGGLQRLHRGVLRHTERGDTVRPQDTSYYIRSTIFL